MFFTSYWSRTVGTSWTNNNNMSIWTFNNDISGAYLEVYITGDNCYKYENNFIVNAKFKYQTKEILSEEFNGSSWQYTIFGFRLCEFREPELFLSHWFFCRFKTAANLFEVLFQSENDSRFAQFLTCFQILFNVPRQQIFFEYEKIRIVIHHLSRRTIFLTV